MQEHAGPRLHGLVHPRGKSNPCNYRSRKPTSIKDLTVAEQHKQGVDNNNNIIVMKVVRDDAPQKAVKKTYI